MDGELLARRRGSGRNSFPSPFPSAQKVVEFAQSHIRLSFIPYCDVIAVENSRSCFGAGYTIRLQITKRAHFLSLRAYLFIYDYFYPFWRLVVVSSYFIFAVISSPLINNAFIMLLLLLLLLLLYTIITIVIIIIIIINVTIIIVIIIIIIIINNIVERTNEQ